MSRISSHPATRRARAGPVERSSVSPKIIFVGFVLSLIAAFFVAFYIYVRWVRYSPLATRHLTPEVASATRLDVEQAVVYQPFREHILALLEIGRENAEPRVKELERRTTLELSVDAREIILAEFPGDQWLILGGGLFVREGVLDQVAEMYSDEGIELKRVDDFLIHSSGVTFALASDGVLLLGSNRAIVASARAVHTSEKREFLEESGVALSSIGVSPTVAAPGAVRQAEVKILVGRTFPVEARYMASDGTKLNEKQVVDLVPQISPLLAKVALHAGETSGQAIELQGSLSREQFEETVAQFAKRVENTLFGTLNAKN